MLGRVLDCYPLRDITDELRVNDSWSARKTNRCVLQKPTKREQIKLSSYVINRSLSAGARVLLFAENFHWLRVFIKSFSGRKATPSVEPAQNF